MPTQNPTVKRPLPLLRVVLLSACLSLCPLIMYAQTDSNGLLPDVPHQNIFNPKAYRVELRGDMTAELRAALLFASETLALQDRPVPTPEMLERRARADIPLLQRALRSEGYYDGQIQVHVDHNATPPLVLFQVQTGPAYILHAVHFDGPKPEQEHDFPAPSPATVNLTLGQRAQAPQIEQGIARLRDHLREYGHPFAKAELAKVIVNHKTRSMTVHYAFDPGPRTFFGPALIQGQQRVSTDYILGKIPWAEGQPFRASLLNTLRTRLLRDGLFTMVKVSHPEKVQPDIFVAEQHLPVTITVVERVPRTIKAGLTYETDTGLGTVLDWEHRNLFGEAQRLYTRLILAERKHMFSSGYSMADFLTQGQSLKFSGEIGQQETDAFDEEGVAVGVAIVRPLNLAWTASLGVRYRFSETTQFGETQTYGLFSVPGELAWDKRNDVLNPTQGWRAFVKAEPYLDILEPGTRFFKLSGGLSAYVPLLPEDRLVLAARGGLGSIMGETVRNLPPDERFYAGGGGSIRGYAYQSIGPEENGRVVGGRSMMESSLELRLRMKNNFGLVAFLDGGQVFPESRLQWRDDFFWGAGLGIRYFMDFAPIRLDVAFPLNRRDKDSAFQIYLSIGQAF